MRIFPVAAISYSSQKQSCGPCISAAPPVRAVVPRTSASRDHELLMLVVSPADRGCKKHAATQEARVVELQHTVMVVKIKLLSS